MKYKFINENSVLPIDYDLELSLIKREYENVLDANSITNADIISIKSKRKKSEEEKAKLELRLSTEEFFSKKIDELGNFYEMVDEDRGSVELKEFDIFLPYYLNDYKNKKIVRKWRVDVNNTSLIQNKINNFKKLLSQSDIKLYKCMECRLLDLEMPYDFKALVSERQFQRDEINRLEQLIKNKTKK